MPSSSKKIRLSKTKNKKQKNTLNKRENNRNKLFEWNEQIVSLLVFGYVRENINFAIPDISSVINNYLKNMFFDYHINNKKYCNVKYLSNDKILCNFRIINESIKRKHNCSTIICTPYISEIFKNYESKIINNNNNINEKTYLTINVKLVKNDCPKIYYFSCGLICIPKKSKINLKELKNIYENIETLKNDDCRYFPTNENCLKNCKVHAISWNKENRNVNIGCDFGRISDCCQSKPQKPQFYICIDHNIISNIYAVHFMDYYGNIIGNNKSNNEIVNGKLKLDFDTFDYLFAMYSNRCGCSKESKIKKFEYQISILKASHW